MNKQSRRDVLRGTAVAALAAGAAGIISPTASASWPAVGVVDAEADLLDLLNRYLAENAWLDAYHADLDGRRDELGWDRVEDLLTETLEASHERCKTMLREMVRLPAGAASSIVVLDMVSEQMEIGDSIYQEQYIELLKSVRAYIANARAVA